MTGLLQKAINLIVGTTPTQRPLRRMSERDLIRLESEIGREIFGEIPKGHRREFFCLDHHTWIWFEEWTDAQTKKERQITTRYEIHPNGILKVQDGHPYKMLEGVELNNFMIAVQQYHESVLRGLYHKDPKTGHRLPPKA